MLKRLEYDDFGQFIAALKAAEKLDLRYRVERERYSGMTEMAAVQVEPREPGYSFGVPKITFGRKQVPYESVVYALEILPDAEDGAAQGRSA
jgi:hypothetical protein